MPETTLTTYGWTTAIWGVLGAFQNGYHISCLNQLELILVPILNISTFGFSILTSVFTVGGLVGSLSAHWVMRTRGRKDTMRMAAVFNTIGAFMVVVSSSLVILVIGRFLTGVGAGLAMCVTPIYLSDIAPPSMRGRIGILTQLSVVFGLMFSQLAGLNLAKPTLWRLVFVFSGMISLVQLLASPAMVESPVWLQAQHRQSEHVAATNKLWTSSETASDASDPLLQEQDSENTEETPLQPKRASGSVSLMSKELRRPLAIVMLAMMSQQVSGIIAVLSYSNDILQKAVPRLGPWVSFGVTVINVIMTFPAIILIEKMGMRRLLVVSAIGTIVSLVLLAYGLDSAMTGLSSFSILAFIVSFSVGMGPVPFVLIPHVSPPHAVTSLSSAAISINASANFVITVGFLKLRDMLSHGDILKEGRIFYLFAGAFSVSVFSLLRAWKA